ncbi:MAG: NDP-sugar synthase [Chloroflexota bacterium]
MKAVILVGGEGTRLRPLTCRIPKAVVPIMNRPFLEHLLRYLAGHGVRDIILAMGYIPDQIQSRLGDGSRLGVRLTYLVESSPLGTAGAVKNAEPFLDDAFIVFNGDMMTGIDLTAMIERHREVKPKASIALTPVDDPTAYGVVETDDRGMVRRFVEKPPRDQVTTNMINAGIYILEPEVLARIPAGAHCMFERQVFPQLLELGEPVLSYPSDAYWIDIGTPEKYLEAHHDLLLGWEDRGVRAEGVSRIHPSARIEGPVLIGEGSTIGEGVRIKGPAVIGRRCRIGREVTIEGAVLWDDVQVAEASALSNCVIGSCGCIESNCRIPAGCVLGDNVTIGQGTRLAPGARVWPDSRVNPETAQS